MKKGIFFFLSVITLYSCNSKHLFDGKYKATVFTDVSMTWVQMEEVTIDGRSMHVVIYNPDKEMEDEFKTTCEQFDDRVEYKGKDGVTYILRANKDGGLSKGGTTYKLINDDKAEEKANTTQISKANQPPFIGTRYFNFYGGSGTGYSLTISKAGKIDLHSAAPIKPIYKAVIQQFASRASGNEPATIYDGEFSNILILDDEKLKIEGNTIQSFNKDGTPKMGCMEEGKPCIVSFQN